MEKVTSSEELVPKEIFIVYHFQRQKFRGCSSRGVFTRVFVKVSICRENIFLYMQSSMTFYFLEISKQHYSILICVNACTYCHSVS